MCWRFVDGDPADKHLYRALSKDANESFRGLVDHFPSLGFPGWQWITSLGNRPFPRQTSGSADWF
jgi:hypothetical protein